MKTGVYYFRAHMYTLVPDQVRQDLDWMAAAGAAVVAIGILEQDFTAARENIAFICNEAEKRRLEVWAVPSRWGNLVAGCPKVPSIFCATKTDSWAEDKHGRPCMGFLGPYASVHATATKELFQSLLENLFSYWPIKGVIWDEPKTLQMKDYSKYAVAEMGKNIENTTAQLKAQAGFFGQLNKTVHRIRPGSKTMAFVYSSLPDEVLDAMGSVDELDIFGCDGRPWAKADQGPGDSDPLTPATKLLLDHGPRFINAANRYQRQSMALIENHALPDSALPLMERRLPKIIKMGWDWLFYYYFPRSCPSPERNMAILSGHLKQSLL